MNVISKTKYNIEHYELLQKFENAEISLLRDIAQINSLYIKM